MATRIFKLGSSNTDTVADIVRGISSATTAANYMTFEHPIGTDLQVTAGKTLHITRIIIRTDTASGGFSIGYGDDGVADGAAAPTTPIHLTGIFSLISAQETKTFDVYIPIPAEKFPFARSNATHIGMCIIEGIEL